MLDARIPDAGKPAPAFTCPIARGIRGVSPRWPLAGRWY